MSLLDQANAPEPNARQRPAKRGLAQVLPYTTVAMLLAALYVAWTFYSRHQSAEQAQRAAEQARVDAEKKQRDLIFGSGAVKFLVFSASPGRVQRGQSTTFCYGVVNAVKVAIEPSIGEPVKPTSRHCVDLKPEKTTTYKITASNEAGQTDSTSLTVHVE